MARTPDTPIPERAYQEIKKRLLAGRFRLRQRLDAGAIASDLGVSTTPVREALLSLTSERLVSFRPSHGFAVAMWSESGLRDLYRWRGQLGELALGSFTGASAQGSDVGASYPSRVADVLAAIEAGAHPELIHAARNADDRLHIARIAETEIWPNIERDLTPILKALSSGSSLRIKRALGKYHTKRIAYAKRIRDCAALLALSSNGA
jgi:DNA-binding GntR family transcriptional regulator